MILLKQMTVLFLIMIAGFICRKIGLLNDEASKKISGLVVNVANPALILTAGINPEATLGIGELLKVMVIALCIYAAVIVISFIFPRLIRVPTDDRGLYQVMMIFSNIGFMGFPLISAVYGNEALLYATLFMIPYNVLIYTYGIAVIRKKDKKEKSNENGREKMGAKATLKMIFNVGVIACILAITLYISGLRVPSVIEETVDYLGGLAAPLSMMVIGDSLVKINVKELFRDWRILVFTLFKQLAVPVAGVLLLKLVGIANPLLGVCMIMMATPVGSMTVMLAQQYEGNVGLASKGVALTTVVSVATIPIVSLLI